MTDARDWRTLPLAGDGRTLVEASAGTGKTWTIGALYLRLLLEERGGQGPLSPRQIVVATYTNAAADELRRRLRGRLLESLDLAASGFPLASAPSPEHTDHAWLHTRWQRADTLVADRERLGLALAELDLAPVSTLHRLCARILADHPFAAGAAFRTPEMVDSLQRVHELADDLWRLLQSDEASAPAAPAAAAVLHARDGLHHVPTRDTVRHDLEGLMQPLVVVEANEVPLATLGHAQATLQAVVERPQIFARSSSVLLKHWRALAEFLATCAPGAPDWATLPKAREVREALAKLEHNQVKPEFHHDPGVLAAAAITEPVLDAVSRMQALPRARFLVAVQAWARAELDRRLGAAGQLGFDDLLTTVHAALQPTAGGARPLADALLAAWPVALIDEFQDTDPVQYGILDAIYRTADNAPRGRLVLIGDPKQAIYRFRGGDIHTYERAKADVPESDRLTLDVNRRSSDDFVEAVNQFYAVAGAKLGAADSHTPIAFTHARPGGRRTAQPYAGPHDAGRRSLVLHSATEGEVDESNALRSCANRITRLLDAQGGHAIGARPLQASDLCVLVPKNDHALSMLALLRERGVPCVLRGRQSVFADSALARDLLVVLHAVVHCHDPSVLRAALGTGLWGLGYQRLRALRDDPAAWQQETARFHRWQRLWRERGVLAVVTALIDEVARAHLDTREGHRVLTDLRHLGELLQACEDQADGMASVLKWLQQRIEGSREDSEDAADANALRIESDAHCVQVMTLHGSKGLEFNVVLLPLMWKHEGRARQHAKGLRKLSGQDGLRRVALDEGSVRVDEREEQDERFRVLYVALTRAVHACHVWIAPQTKKTADGALAAPLALATPHLDVATLAARGADRIAVVQGWRTSRVFRSPPAIRVRTGDEARTLPAVPERILPSRHSFTTLVARRRRFEADPWAAAGDERDATVLNEPFDTSGTGGATTAATGNASVTPHPDLDSLLGVAGADFGNAIHRILELRVPGEPLAAQLTLVRESLVHYDVTHRELTTEALAERLIPRLQAVLDADLAHAGVRLARLPATALRAEMEFNYALDGASLARLRTTCARHGWPQLIPERTQVLAGLMNGKIDLVFEHGGRFHILDWKGNDLGDGTSACLEDYAPAALERKMDSTHYRFQALLYTVAIDRYLRDRLGDAYQREQHLGDCWYLFVRATGLQLPDGTPCGVWRHRFADALIDEVQAELSRVEVDMEVAA